jgi:GH35 family endo-1,4-beta-xylanase
MRALWVVGCLLWVAGCIRTSRTVPPVAIHDGALTTTISGADLALKSNGEPWEECWRLETTGFVGTYVQLDAPGEVTIALEAFGGISKPARGSIVINDERVPLEVDAAWTTLRHTFALPRGTNFIRIEFIRDPASWIWQVTLRQLTIRGARVLNEHNDANALAASETYIKHCRAADVVVRLPDAVAPGTEVRAKLVKKEFNFGTNAPGVENKYFIDNPPADSDAAKFQKFVLEHFNMLVPSNAGKWVFHEPTAAAPVSMEHADAIMRFAREHSLRGRMHNLIWDHPQQPAWVLELLRAAEKGDADAKAKLRAAISNRIKYYVRDRATNYVELDVLNESLHQYGYYKVFGAEGLADIYRECAQAARDGGANPVPLMMTNEFNVLQWSRPYPFKDQPFDPYANWYRRHVEQLLAAGAPVTGIGIQYNVDFRPEAMEKCPHSAARIFAALQNLSVLGLRLTLTEFQITPDATPQQAAQVYYELMRLVYGNANMQSFLVWGFWAGNTPDLAVLANKDWTLTPAGRLYERLMKEWTTDVNVIVSPGHTIGFNGHFGEYEITAGDKIYHVTIRKGVSTYEVH